ncbi:Wound-responsive family protein [Quillaja saponaria]|uniref:Wound-responsive family protein n=1 Tax=Quillaja saponaria TaxID=32244 RepID=A0AAD7KYQ2_QUISA|nr:Wound-responsive family protein [Quillaja saponaria]
MSYLNRAWVAASVAVVHGHTDQGHKWKSGLNSLKQNRRRLLFTGETRDLRPISSMSGSDFTGVLGNCDGEERRRQADDSLRKVMYLNCWGQG